MAATVATIGLALTAAVPSAHGAPAQGGPGGGKSAVRPAPRAPTGPPLVSGEGAFATPSQVEESAASSASSPLLSNGLGSPLCGDRVALSANARANCLTSGFVAAAAPTGNYGLDVHIETGFPDFRGEAAAFVEDYMIKPPWTALVWAVHGLLVALQWAYLLDVLHGSVMPTVASVLRTVGQTVTRPWLAVVLAIASVLIAYRGIVKRRVADTLGEALAILAMMALGLWMIADPLGTVGAAARWADAASLQTLAAVSTGTPARQDEALTDAAGQLFGATVDAPWCYMEFGNVAWCDDPSRLEPRLRAAGLKIAAAKRSQAAGTAGVVARRREAAIRLLRSAETNGELFLALVPNGPERNSINQEGSLLRTLCRSPSVSECTGPTASEAEFRGEGGVVDRCVGLAMIAAGALGMILLLGFIVTRLLGAALMSLLLLLAAPVVVLMPALGEGGRAGYRDWAGRLLGAIVTKLIWSFLLGVVLVAMKLVLDLHGLGWWVQWLLLSVLWWGAFRRRHDMLGLARIGHDGSARTAPPRTTVGRAGSRARAFAWGMLVDRSRRRRREPSPPGGWESKPPARSEELTAERASSGAGWPESGQDASGSRQQNPSDGSKQPGDAETSSAVRPTPLDRQRAHPDTGGPSAEGHPPAGDRQEVQRERSGGRADGERGVQPDSEHGHGDVRPDPRSQARPDPRSQARPDPRSQARKESGNARAGDHGAPAPPLPPDRGEQAREAAGTPASTAPAQRGNPPRPDPSRAIFDEVVRRIREDAAARQGGGDGEPGDSKAGRDAPEETFRRAARARRRRRQLGEG